MKKLLLLMAAMLLLIPPLRAEQIVIYDNTKTAVANTDMAHVTYSTTANAPTSAYSVKVISNIRILRYLGAADEVFCENTKWVSSNGTTTLSATGASTATATARYLTWSKNTNLKFYCTFGKVNSVTIDLASTNAPNTTSRKVTHGTFATNTNYKMIVDADDNGVVELYHTGTNAARINKITIDYTPGTPLPPADPQLTVSTTYLYEYDKENNTLAMPCLPKTSCVTVGMPKYASALYYTFNKDIEVPTSLSDINTSATTKTGWVAYTSSGINFTNAKPTNLTDLTSAENEFDLRVIAYSSLAATFSNELTTHCRYFYLPSPYVNKAKTEAVPGQKYDEATNTVTYTGGNPIVYINAVKSSNSLLSYYTSDFTDPSLTDSKGRLPIASGEATVQFTNWAEGLPYPPVGTTNQVKVVSYTSTISSYSLITNTSFYDQYYTSHDSKPFTVNIVRVAPDKPEAPHFNQALVDGKDNYTGDLIPSRIGFDNSVELTFAFPTTTKKHNKIFASKPEGEVDASAWDEEIAFNGDKLTFTKDNLPAGSTDAWIGVAKSNDTGTSYPLWIHVGLKAPDAPEINYIRGSYDNGSERVVFGASLDANFTVGEDADVVEYCMEKVTGSVWPEAPGALTERFELPVTDGNPLNIIGEKIETGRLFYRAGRKIGDATVWSEWAYADFKRENPQTASLNGKYNTWPSQIGDGALVHINEDLRIMGYYTTNATIGVSNSSPSYLYVINKDGEAIKLVGADLANGSWPAYITSIPNSEYESKNYVLKGVYGWVKYVNNENNMPEIYLTNGSTSDSQALYGMLPVPVESAEWTLSAAGEAAQNPADRVSIDRQNDFSRYVTVRSLKWLDSKNEFEMADGTRIPVYGRFKEHPIYNYTSTLIEGRLYCVRGFVGLASGTLSIFPNAEILQCPGTPNLFAPNPITGDVDKDGFIDIQAVSDKVTFRVEGQADGKSGFTYTVNGGEELPVDNTTKKFDVDLSGLGNGATMKLVVYAHLNGMKSLAPAKVRITKRSAVQVESIQKYKEIELSAPSADVYQITGNVVIEAMTDKYLYVRDFTNAPEAEMDDDEHLRRLLIRNDHGWTTKFEKDGTTAPLAVGDVIHGFAISPTHDRGNLLGDNTGFARTIKYDHHESTGVGNYETEPAGPTSNFRFSGKYRMCMVKLEGVQLQPRQPNTDPYTKDDYPYIYTLDLPTPTRMRMDVFVRTGFAEAYEAGVGFDLTGIAMIDNEDDNDTEDRGEYAFALMSFEGSAKVAAPQVFIDGQEPVDGEDAEIKYSGTGTIRMTAEAKDADGNDLTLTGDQKVTIYYSIDGLDPLKVLNSRKEYTPDASELELGEGDIEIRAFAAVRGMTPSDIVTRRFRKSSHDVQFILNFLQSAQEGEAYRFTGDTRVVAMGGDYMFVVGRVGHYLPIQLTGGWKDPDLGISENDLLSGFTVRYHVDNNGNHIAVADEFTGTFKSSGVADDKDFPYQPDVTAALNPDVHPRRYVTLTGVTVSAGEAPSGRDIDNWNITESGDHETHALRVGMLGDVEVFTVDENGTEHIVAEGLVDGATYDITGFVMFNDPSKEGKMEMWPRRAKLLQKTANVKASFSAGTVEGTNDAGEVTATFQGMTMVSLTCPTKDSKIYYAIDDARSISGDNLTWYEYQHEFAVTKSTYIHAKAIAPNAVESDHTHIDFTALEQSGDVEFNVTAGDGETTLTISPAAGAASGSIIWYSEGNDRSCNKVYTAGTELKYTEETTVYACIQEPGKAKGAVSSIRVMVVDKQGSTGSKVSGKVKFTVTENEDGSAMIVNMEPDGDMTGTIYYLINPTVAVTPENGLVFTEPFPMTEGGRIMAILVESGKLPGEPTDVTVWLIPTDIDGVDADRTESEVRAEGGDIIAPAGSEVYDITGRRVNPTGLRSGIYIVRTPGGKSVKIRI